MYPMDSVIHLLNNWGLVDNVICLLNNWCQDDKDDGTRRSLEIEFTKGSVANRTPKFTFSLFRALLYSHLMLGLCRDMDMEPIEQIKLYRKEKTSGLHMIDLASV